MLLVAKKCQAMAVPIMSNRLLVDVCKPGLGYVMAATSIIFTVNDDALSESNKLSHHNQPTHQHAPPAA